MRRVWLSFCLFACVERGPGPTPELVSKFDVTKARITEVPPDVVRRDVTFGAVDYLGTTLSASVLVPGDVVTITHYWRVNQPIIGAWRPFTQLRGPVGTPDYVGLDVTPMRAAYPPAKWQTGELLADTRDFTVPPDWKSQTATVWVGFYRVGARGLADRMPVLRGEHADNAVVAAVVPVDLSQAPPPPGTLYVRRTTTPPTIDGLGTEPAWATVPSSSDFPAGDGSRALSGKTTGKLLWDDTHLYVFVSASDTDVRSDFTVRDEAIWKQDVVEVFIDADKNRRGYIELQVSPANIQFDKWFAKTRNEEGDTTWNSEMTSAVVVRGTLNANGPDQGFDVEMAIPWTAVKGADPAMAVNLPPRLTESMRMNVVRVDYTSGSAAWASWNRIGNDFHGLDRMLTVVFADERGKLKPLASSAEMQTQARSRPSR